VVTPQVVRGIEVRLAGTLGVRPLPDVPALGAGQPVGSVTEELLADRSADESADGGRPRLVGIDGHASGAPRRRRIR
jgi:hypothetical protein